MRDSPRQLIGWQMDSTGKNPTKAPLNLTPVGLKCHTAIISQPGYGKTSTARGLAEEMLSKTYINFLILDSNADFIKLSEIDPAVWINQKTKNWLGKGNSYAKFARRWRDIEFLILTNRPKLPKLSHPKSKISPIAVNWSALTIDDRIDYLGFSLTGSAQSAGVTRLISEFVASNVMTYGEAYAKDTIETFKNIARRVWVGPLNEKNASTTILLPEELQEKNISAEISSSVFGRANDLWQMDIWGKDGHEYSLQRQVQELVDNSSIRRVRVIDLPSLLRREEKLIVCHSSLVALWRKAVERHAENFGESKGIFPTFIVIDEAHKLLPLEPRDHCSERLLDIVLDYATEGRKYGLFLILITQRPSFLNSKLLSLCENLCLLRITNRNDLEILARSFVGFPDKWEERVATLKNGEALFNGNFVNNSKYGHVAPARTIEGGGNISDSSWLKDPLRS